MTTVLEGKEGWHLFRLTGRRHAHSQEFKDVKEQIRYQDYFRKQRRDTMKTYLEELREDDVPADDAASESIKIAKPATPKSVLPANPWRRSFRTQAWRRTRTWTWTWT